MKSKRQKEIRKIIDAVAKDYADKGLLIEGGWEALKAVSMPPDAPQIQINEMRNAYFAGAQHLFSTIMSILEPGIETTKNDMRRIMLIHEELERFLRELKLKHWN
jgi:hypothetical protein